jgi:hypothetical protein
VNRAPDPAPAAAPPVWREVVWIAGRTIFYFVLLVLILLLWEGRGLFIYENF